VLRCRVIFEDIFQGKANVHYEAENMVYKNVVIADTQEVLNFLYRASFQHME